LVRQFVNHCETGSLLPERVSFLPAITEKLCLESIFETAALGAAICDVENQILRTNDAFKRMLGYGEEELNGVRYSDLVHPEDREQHGGGLRALSPGERDFRQAETRFLSRDRRVVWGRRGAPGRRGADT